MSGHSKWATIKRKKGAEDAKRGKIFTKLIRELTVAAREGGGDPSSNARLRTVMEKARASNMPQDNVTRAIKKGTGELEGVAYEESTLEGYGPGGAAVIVTLMTDNKNRTVSEIRNIFSKNSGNLGEVGCVSWIFQKKGSINFNKTDVAEESLMETALEAGAEDIRDDEEGWIVVTDPSSFEAVKKATDAKGWKPVSAEITLLPQNQVSLSGGDAEKILKLMEALEDYDDVQNVYANFDISKSELERLSKLAE